MLNPANQNMGCPLLNRLGAQFTVVRSEDGSKRFFIYQAEGLRAKDPIGSGVILLRCCGECLKCSDPEPKLATHFISPHFGVAGEYIGMETNGLGNPKTLKEI